MTVWCYQLIICYCTTNAISTDVMYCCCWFWLGQVKHEMGWCKIYWAQTSLACFNPWQGLEQFISLLVKCPCLSKVKLYTDLLYVNCNMSTACLLAWCFNKTDFDAYNFVTNIIDNFTCNSCNFGSNKFKICFDLHQFLN